VGRPSSVSTERDETIRVLVVDDHAVVRRGLFAFLDGEADLEVVGDAGSGAEALELLAALDAEERRPDVVLMDLQMEPIDGIETTRRISARYDDVEVVALTSFGEEERVRAALEAGASGYLLKDADADEVAVAIRAAHRGELQLDPAVARYLTAALLATPRPDDAGVLTSRELEVVRLVGDGAANKAIAAELGISERTARTHVSKILGKLGLSSRTQAALWAAREGLVGGDPPQDGRAPEQDAQSLKNT
jgi:DNA-binding NarL/FixJ family response regulator